MDEAVNKFFPPEPAKRQPLRQAEVLAVLGPIYKLDLVFSTEDTTQAYASATGQHEPARMSGVLSNLADAGVVERVGKTGRTGRVGTWRFKALTMPEHKRRPPMGLPNRRKADPTRPSRGPLVDALLDFVAEVEAVQKAGIATASMDELLDEIARRRATAPKNGG